MTSSSHGAAAESLGVPPLPGFGGAAPSERPPASVVMDPEVPWSHHCFAGRGGGPGERFWPVRCPLLRTPRPVLLFGCSRCFLLFVHVQ